MPSGRPLAVTSAEIVRGSRDDSDMGLLTLDVTDLGIVMTTDSQPIELAEDEVRVLPTHGRRRRTR